MLMDVELILRLGLPHCRRKLAQPFSCQGGILGGANEPRQPWTLADTPSRSRAIAAGILALISERLNRCR